MPPLRTQIKNLCLLGFWIIFGGGYFGRFPLPGFLADVYFLALAGLTAVSAGGYGSLLVNRWAPDILSSLERVVLSIAAGFGLISLVMILAGLLGFWTPVGGTLIVGAGLCMAWPYRRNAARWSELLGAGFQDSAKIPLFLILGGAAAGLLIALAPVTYYDSLVYHFALPQAYVQAKHWVSRPELIYSAFPQTMEMIWTLGLLLAGDAVANLLGWIIAVIGVLAAYAFGRRFFGTRTALWAAALLCVMPAYLLLSSGGYIDVGLAAFSFLSFFVLCLWRETPTSKMLALAGFFAGCAVGTKYTGAIPLALGTTIILTKSRIPAQPRIYAGQMAVYGGVALAVVSPWLIKNLYCVGNPVFPFFYALSTSHLNPWIGQAAAGYFRGLTEYAPRSGWGLLALLWDMAVHGLNFGGGMDVLGDLGWAPLFAFLPALWLLKKKPPVLVLLLLYCAGFYIAWGMSRPVLRFLLPLAPFLAVASACGFDQGISQQTRLFRGLGRAFLAILIFSNVRLFFEVSDALSLFKVPLGLETRRDYLSEKLNYYGAALYVNTLAEDSLTYVVGDQRGYYYNRPVLVTPVFNANPMTEWANEASSSAALAANLKARRITHLLINNTEMQRLDASYHIYPFTARGRANWETLRSSLARSVYRDRHCEVLAL